MNEMRRFEKMKWMKKKTEIWWKVGLSHPRFHSDARARVINKKKTKNLKYEFESNKNTHGNLYGFVVVLNIWCWYSFIKEIEESGNGSNREDIGKINIMFCRIFCAPYVRCVIWVQLKIVNLKIVVPGHRQISTTQTPTRQRVENVREEWDREKKGWKRAGEWEKRRP